MKRIFGTDGIRARANSPSLSPSVMMRLGIVLANELRRGGHRHRVLIGRDTRLSGRSIEAALTAGLTAGGMDVLQAGEMPTPAVAMMTRSLRADLGIMVTASHNPYTDNGIKLFGPDGYKLSDEMQDRLEAAMANTEADRLASPEGIGQVIPLSDGPGRFVEHLKSQLPRELGFERLKIVLDCANGAAVQVGPQILRELGASVVAIGTEANGLNINQDCGALHTRQLRARVVEEGADIGIAFDGDADRVLICDELGNMADGDALLGVITRRWARQGRLKNATVVTSVMSNMALDLWLETQDIDVIRTKVGDRHLVQEMRARDLVLGSEPCGHMVLSEQGTGTTGDGLRAALEVLAEIIEQGGKASEVLHPFEAAPQALLNVPCANRAVLDSETVQAAISGVSERLGRTGRVLVRPSGTEPVIRVLAEGTCERAIGDAVNEIADAIQGAV